MLHHVSVGVRDIESAAQFYDAVLGALGYKRVMEVLPYGIAYGDFAPEFWVQLPHNQQVATAGNGVHISFIARSQEQVDAFHQAALENGGTSAGEPGPRPDYTPDYYGAFVFDLDGNKLEATLLPLPAEPIEAAKPARKTAKKAAKKAVKKSAKKAAKPAAKKVAKKAAKKVVTKRIVVKVAPKPVKEAVKDTKGKSGKAKDKGGKKDKKDKKGKKGKRK